MPTTLTKVLPTCKDCNAPVGEDLRPIFECWYWGQLKQQKGWDDAQLQRWRSMGWDPPCESNAYDLWSEKRSQRGCAFVVGLFFTIMVLASILAAWFQ